MRRRLRVAVLSSGDELVQPGIPLAAGKGIVLRDNNYSWSGDEQSYWSRKQNTANRRARNSIIFYEVHPKGISAASLPGIPGLANDYRARFPGTFRGIGDHALETAGGEILEGRGGLLASQQALGRHHDEGLSHRPDDLPAQHVEELRAGRRRWA